MAEILPFAHYMPPDLQSYYLRRINRLTNEPNAGMVPTGSIWDEVALFRLPPEFGSDSIIMQDRAALDMIHGARLKRSNGLDLSVSYAPILQILAQHGHGMHWADEASLALGLENWARGQLEAEQEPLPIRNAPGSITQRRQMFALHLGLGWREANRLAQWPPPPRPPSSVRDLQSPSTYQAVRGALMQMRPSGQGSAYRSVIQPRQYQTQALYHEPSSSSPLFAVGGAVVGGALGYFLFHSVTAAAIGGAVGAAGGYLATSLKNSEEPPGQVA